MESTTIEDLETEIDLLNDNIDTIYYNSINSSEQEREEANKKIAELVAEIDSCEKEILEKKSKN